MRNNMFKFFLYPMLVASFLSAQDLPKVNEIFKSYILKNVYINGFDNESPKLVHITVTNGVIANISDALPNDNSSFIYDCDSAFIYPAFFDGGLLMKFLQQKDSAKFPPGNPPNSAAGIQPELNAADFLKDNSKSFSKMTKLGFLKANIFLDGGLISGGNVLSNLNGKENLIQNSTGIFFRFKSARGVYPSSIIGMLAKLRQLFFDAEDYKRRKEAFISTNSDAAFTAIDPAYEELNNVLSGKKKIFFEANSESEILRVLKLKDEFKFNCVIIGAREVHKVLDKVKAANISIIYSLNLPGEISEVKNDSAKPKDVVSLYLSKEEDDDLKKRYKETYDNLWRGVKFLKENKIPFTIATMDVQSDSIKPFLSKLKNYGVTEKEILEILSFNSAKILGFEKKFGKIEKGFSADFFLTDKKYFDKKSKLKFFFINGEKFDLESEERK